MCGSSYDEVFPQWSCFLPDIRDTDPPIDIALTQPSTKGAANDVMVRLRTALDGHYRVEREVGRGGMASVYLATDVQHDREVAIKVLHPELGMSLGADRFEREIRLAGKLQHPHILGMYDSGIAGNLLYYVMPFVKGESLRHRIDREGMLPVEDAVAIALEINDALGYAHSQGVIHRDIKPENILLSDGHALVADFGIARAANDTKLTATGMSLGTPFYMSPEQAIGEVVGPTADLYSLGCVLYEMLAGQMPFTGKNAMQIMARHAMEKVPSIRIVRSAVPAEVEQTIFAAMAKFPRERPQSAAQFAELMGSRVDAGMETTQEMPATQTMPTAQAPKTGRAPLMIGVAVILIAIIALGVWKLVA